MGRNKWRYDASTFMLDALRKKCLQKNFTVEAWEGYVQDLERPAEYDLVFIPSGSFCLITSLEHAKKSIEKIFNSLKQGGYFVFESETLTSAPQSFGVWRGSELMLPNGNTILLSCCDLPVNDNVLTTVCRYELIDINKICNFRLFLLRLI